MSGCLNCGSDDHAREFTVTREDRYMMCLPETDRINAKYRECTDCRAMYLSVPNIDLEAYRNGSYYDVDASSAEFFLKRHQFILGLPPERSDNRARVSRILEFLITRRLVGDRTVLDVGAGLGVFMAQMAREGWAGAALEPDPRLGEFMRTVLPPEIEVLQGALEDHPPTRRFDLVTVNRVAEHVKEASEFLRRCKERLKPNGILYLELPDTRSFYADGPNNEAFGYGHYTVYSPTALCHLAQTAGFEVEELLRVKEPSTKFTIYAFLSQNPAGDHV